jgi:proteasome alpha subunit
VADEHGYAVMGGAADVVAGYLKERYAEGADLTSALRLAVAALGHSVNERGEAGDRVVPHDDLEVAVLDRTRMQPRKFKRIRGQQLTDLLGPRGPEEPGAASADDGATAAPAAGATTDDPSDPTDTVSGSVAPLEDPVSGEPVPPVTGGAPQQGTQPPVGPSTTPPAPPA